MFKSERYFLPKIISKVKTVLDIGCSSGGFFEIFHKINPNIEYTGVDIDSRSIESASKIHQDKNINFILGDFLQLPFPQKYELVNMMEILFLYRTYKSFLKKMIECSNKYIHFTNRVKLFGPTIISKRKSYAYYLDTEEKCDYIIFALGDFLDLLCSPKFNLKSISVYGYKMPKTMAKKRKILPVPLTQIYTVAFLLEKHSGDSAIHLHPTIKIFLD